MKYSGKIIYKGIEYLSDDINKMVKEIESVVMGLKPATDEVLGLYLTRNVSMLATIFALYELKIPFIPLDINAPIERNQNIIQTAGVRYVLTNTRSKIEGAEFIDINMATQCEEINVMKYNHIAYCIPTSGTSGMPKTVQIGRSAFDTWMEDFKEFLVKGGLDNNSKILCVSDYNFDMFMIESIFAMYMGMDIVLAGEDEQKNPVKLAKLIKEYEVDFVQATPSRMRLIGTMDRDYKCLLNVKCISLGGEKIGSELLKRLQKSTTAKLINIYGPTETTVCCICADVTTAREEVLGLPLNHSNIFLLDEEMEQVTDGEICVAGSCIADGYRGNIKITAEKFVQWNDMKIYKTGDLAYISEAGMYVYKGRKDNQIKLRGYRIELEEVESMLCGIEGISGAVVSVNKDKEELIAYYTSISGEKADERKLVSEMKKTLPSYMVPYRYIHMHEFPMTSNGKVDRQALDRGLKMKADERLNLSGDGGQTAETEETERNVSDVNDKADDRKNVETTIIQLISIKSETDRAKITKESDLSELGLDSLSYMELIVEIEELYGFEFEESKLSFKEINTVGELVEYVKGKI